MGHGSSVHSMKFNSIRSTSRRRSISGRRPSITHSPTKKSHDTDDSVLGPTYGKSDGGTTLVEVLSDFATSFLPTHTKLLLPLVQTGVDVQSHKMTGHGVFRGDAYRWLLVQLELKVSVAQDCIHSYVGHSQRLDLRGHPHLFIAADYVDFVCSRSVPALLDCVGHATWNMLTDVPTHAVRTTKVLDTAGKDICYVQVRIENGHRRNVPVVVNVLYKRTVTPHQVMVVFRTIHEDDLFPMPTQPLHIGLSGWMIFKQGVDSCSEQTLVRVRLQDAIAGPDRSAWLASVVQKWFQAQESSLRVQLLAK